MTIISEDGKMIVGVGGSIILYSLYSTVKSRIKVSKRRIDEVLEFLRTGECKLSNIEKTLEQMRSVKEELKKLNPDDAVYDYNDLSKKAPWQGNISSEVHSCMDLFTTDDGKLLVDELISLLEYSEKRQISVVQP